LTFLSAAEVSASAATPSMKPTLQVPSTSSHMRVSRSCAPSPSFVPNAVSAGTRTCEVTPGTSLVGLARSLPIGVFVATSGMSCACAARAHATMGGDAAGSATIASKRPLATASWHWATCLPGSNCASKTSSSALFAAAAFSAAASIPWG
jgi:hypothetical protein